MKIKKQNDIKDCGVYIIQSLHNFFYKNWIDKDEIKLKANFGLKGINIHNLIILGKQYGIKLTPYEATLEKLIVSLNSKYYISLIENNGMNHYVIFKYHKKKFIIYDSIKGEYILTYNEFFKIYKGVLITIDKCNYIPNKINIKKPFWYLFKNFDLIIWIFFSIFISVIFMFISSLFIKIVVDKIIPGKLSSTLNLLCLSFVFLSFLRAINSFIRSYFIKKISIKIEQDITFNFFKKIKRCSLKEINKLTKNDMLRRISMISHISGFISNSLFVIFNEIIILIFSTSILVWISPKLFSISFAFAGFITITTIIFGLFIKDQINDSLKYQMNLFNSNIDMVNSIMDFKNKNYENNFDNNFNNNYKKDKNKSFEIWKYNSIQLFIENFLIFLSPIIIIFIGVNNIFQNKISVGMLLMFLSIFNNFISPIKEVCSFLLQLPRQLNIMNLISFILSTKEEDVNSKGIKLKKLKSIYLKKLEIGYDRPLMTIKNFKINQNIRLSGKNGTGKTTLIKSLTTLIDSKGELFFNEYKISNYSLSDIRTKCIIISNDQYIPDCNLLEFITFNNKDYIKIFFKNLEKYNLISLLDKLDIKLDMPLKNNGMNISSGQRQIICLLKLFAFNYELIILDEAFENIDIHKTKGLKLALLDFQKCIFIEISHSKKYITNGKEVDIEQINSYSE